MNVELARWVAKGPEIISRYDGLIRGYHLLDDSTFYSLVGTGRFSPGKGLIELEALAGAVELALVVALNNFGFPPGSYLIGGRREYLRFLPPTSLEFKIGGGSYQLNLRGGDGGVQELSPKTPLERLFSAFTGDFSPNRLRPVNHAVLHK